MPTVVFRLCGHPEIGPKPVSDQSRRRMSVPISPPPKGKLLLFPEIAMRALKLDQNGFLHHEDPMAHKSESSHIFLISALGQTRTSSLGAARPLPPSADIGPGGQCVGQAPQFCPLCASHSPRHGHQIPRWALRHVGPHSGRGAQGSRQARLRCLEQAHAGIQGSGAALGDAINAGYLYLEVRCLGCDTHQTVALDIVRRPKTTPIHELERCMRYKDCSEVRGYKRSHLVALRPHQDFGERSAFDVVARGAVNLDREENP